MLQVSEMLEGITNLSNLIEASELNLNQIHFKN
jgi:hypothetical protein